MAAKRLKRRKKKKEGLATKLRSASYTRQADTHGLSQTFIRRTSPDKNSHRFAGKRQRSEIGDRKTIPKELTARFAQDAKFAKGFLLIFPDQDPG